MTHNDILPGGPPVDMGLIDAIWYKYNNIKK